MISRTRTTILAVFSVALSSATFAQTPSPNKIGSINLRKAIVTTAEGKRASTRIESEFSARRNELESLEKQIADIQRRLSSGGNVMKQEEQDRLARQGERLSQQYQRKQNEFQEDLGSAQTEAAAGISSKLLRLLSDYAPKNGFAAVLDYSTPNSPVLYAATDITEEIIRLYDKTYPANSAAAKPAPAGK